MMTLTDAASYFNTTEFTDAYGSGEFFKGRLEAFPDSMRDSLATQRRILIVSPSVVIPQRRAIVAEGQVWIVGDLEIDSHDGKQLRNKYICHRATGDAFLGSFAQVLRDSGMVRMCASKLWMKEYRESEESSGMYGQYNLFFAEGEDIEGDSLMFFMQNRWHLSRAAYHSAGGFQVVVADELPGAVRADVAYAQRTYTAATDSNTVTNLAMKGLLLRWQSHFTYFSNAAETFSPGDDMLVLLKSDVTPKSGDTLSVNGKPYRVCEVANGDAECWNLHVRHA